jgi:methylase of polypeptide subunit release factors
MSGPFRLDSPFDAAAFRDALARGGYNADCIKALKRDIKGSEGIELALLDRHTAASSDARSTFARLFFLGREVKRSAIREAIAPGPLEPLTGVGLLIDNGESVRAAARIEIHSELLVCSDFVHHTHDRRLASDHILGVGPGAISLAALTPRSECETALDLGTGGGIQALLASRFAERVVATDICPRALNFAAFNARLNGIDNIELRSGSFFDPVKGERFDRIVANPPFVIAPASRFVYRDGGLAGDGVSEHVARRLAAHLEDGGFAVALLNWQHTTPDDWTERPKSWTRGNGCDVRWMRFDDEDPLSYAASWLRQEERRDEAAAGALLDEWVRYYGSIGAARIALGAVVMRKRTGPRNWVRCDDIALDITLNACGDQIERVFDAEELLEGLENERALLDLRFKIHPEHYVEQRLAIRNGGWALESNKLHITNGMDFCAQTDMHTMRFLAELDGNRTVREAAQPIADDLEKPLEDVVPICLDITKRMLRIGLLVRA